LFVCLFLSFFLSFFLSLFSFRFIYFFLSTFRNVLSKASRPVPVFTRVPVRWVPGSFFPWVKLPGRWAGHSSHLEPRLRMSGANIPLPSSPSWKSRSQHHRTIFRRVRKIATSDYQLRHVCPSVRPHGTTRLPLEGFSWNFIFDYFRKYVEKIQVSLKRTRIKSTRILIHRFYHTSLIYS